MDRKRSNQDIPVGTGEVKILFAGSGGQGILLMGKVLAQSLLLEGSQLSWFPSYGAEVRGGTCKCMVISSGDEIASPYIIHPDYLIVMNEPSYVKYSRFLKPDGRIFYNSSLIDENIIDKNTTHYAVPATEKASDIGEVKIANTIMLGAFVKETKIVSPAAVVKSLEGFIKKDLLVVNLKAFKLVLDL